MKNTFIGIGKFSLAHFTTWIFLGLKFGWITRDGCSYNWSNPNIPHTLWFLLIVTINHLGFLMLIKKTCGLIFDKS